MKLLPIASLLLVIPLCGQTPPKPKAKKATTASIAKTLRQMERDWAQAGLSKDVKTVNRIVADDWISIGFDGKTETKAQALAALKSGAATSQSIDLGEMKVRVFGDAAIVTGTDVEKAGGSGNYAWMDVFVKRNGHWQAVASQSTKIAK